MHCTYQKEVNNQMKATTLLVLLDNYYTAITSYITRNKERYYIHIIE